MPDATSSAPPPTPGTPPRAGRRPGRLLLVLGALLVAAAGAFAWLRHAGPGEPKVLLIGIDGADWETIDRLAAEGSVPNLARLKKEGTWARLRSQEPILSPIIWTTIATGKTADKHGITWFMVDNPKTGGRMPITSNVRRVKAFWSILTGRDIPVGVIGWWATWPAEAVKGFIVSDFMAFHGFGVTGRSVKTDIGKTHPPELLAEIQPKMRAPGDIPYDLVKRFVDVDQAEFDRINAETFDFKIPIHHFRNILATALSYRDIALQLLAEKKPRVMAVYFEGIDSSAHLFMQYAPPRLPWVEEAEYDRYHRVVDEYYRFQDEIIGELLAAAGDDTTTIVLSDHGFKTGTERPRQEKQIDVAKAHTWHRLYGVLVARGPAVRAGGQVEKASIADITPTLLHLLGLPKGQDMDGIVLTDLFDAEWLKHHPVETIPSWETEGEKPVAVAEVDASVSAEAEERLRALGYIGDSEDSSSEVHDNEGAIQLRKGDVDGAMESFQKAVKMDPLNPGPHLSLGILYKQQGRFVDALREMEFALKLKPENLGARLEIADVYFAQKDYDRALEEYRAVLDKDAKQGRAVIGIGNVHRMRGKNDEARAEFERAAELEPKNFVPRYNLGVLAQDAGDAQAARRWYEEALKLAPRSAVIHNNLGNLLERQGNLDEAIRSYRAARDADPQHFESRYNLGTLLLRKGELKDAEKMLKEALALQPDAPFAHNNLATTYLRLGWGHKALEEYRLLMRLAPDRADAFYQASRILAASGQVDEARSLLKQALDKGGKPLRASASNDPVFKRAGIQVNAL